MNLDSRKTCQNCGSPLVALLRNRFKVQRVLGQGGFGRTYLAEDRDNLNALCVVKQLVPSTQSTWAMEKATQLFAQEAQQLQNLGPDYPQIPTLIAYFQEGGFLYLVQQFINGKNLSQELQEQDVFSEYKIRLLLQEILPVLQFIHSRGVIHRDIKPDNIIRCDDTGNLVLIDFGVSRSLQANMMARSGTIVGSFGYAPPEQIHEGIAYPASDLFSLGVTCFYLLTNQFPGDLLADENYNWINHWQDWVKIRLSPELILILNKLLQIDYRQRYQSATDISLPLVENTKQSIPFTQATSFKQSKTHTPTLAKKKQSPITITIPWSQVITVLGSYILAGFFYGFNIWMMTGILIWSVAVAERVTRNPHKIWSEFERELVFLICIFTLMMIGLSAKNWASYLAIPVTITTVSTVLVAGTFLTFVMLVLAKNWDYLTIATATIIVLSIVITVVILKTNVELLAAIIAGIVIFVVGLPIGLVAASSYFATTLLKSLHRFRSFMFALSFSWAGLYFGWLIYQILLSR